jgi:hypothetical protein
VAGAIGEATLDAGSDGGLGQLPRRRPAAPLPGTHRSCSTFTATCPACSATSTVSSSDRDANILAQVLGTNARIGYVIIDFDAPVAEAICADLGSLATTIRARALA